MAEDEGLLALGGTLDSERLKLAYTFGIFPWYSESPILWWFTNPRCVLYPSDIKISKSMRPLVHRLRPWKITMDEQFSEVISKCASVKRKDQNGTWINHEIVTAYTNLYQEGIAHSIEVWDKHNELIGGLYGVCIGKIFFGESMFSVIPNASKYALIHLCQYLENQGCELIDCQQDTPHMRRMGAVLFTKLEFWNIIKRNVLNPNIPISNQSFNDWLDSTYTTKLNYTIN